MSPPFFFGVLMEFLAIFWLVSILIIVVTAIKLQQERRKFHTNYSFISSLPESSKLYYEEKTSRGCRRCKTNGVQSFLIIRKRFRITSKHGSIKVEGLTHICVCNSCGYRGLSSDRLGE
jgi:hypothetical protein